MTQQRNLSSRPCAVDGCNKGVRARGWCTLHYSRWRQHGDPLTVLPRNGNTTVFVPPEERTCTGCGYMGPLIHFRPQTSTCKTCTREAKAANRAAKPEQYKAYNQKHRSSERWRRQDIRKSGKAVGLDPDEAERLYAESGGICEICGLSDAGAKKRLSFDHCHATGNFRGFLCSSCNTALGSFKDDVTRLRAAIAYLTTHSLLEAPVVTA